MLRNSYRRGRCTYSSYSGSDAQPRPGIVTLMLNRLLRCGKIAQASLQSSGGIVGGLNLFMERLELQAYAGEHFLVGEQLVKQLLPVLNLAVVEHELGRDVFQELVLGGSGQGRYSLLLFAGHGNLLTRQLGDPVRLGSGQAFDSTQDDVRADGCHRESAWISWLVMATFLVR